MNKTHHSSTKHQDDSSATPVKILHIESNNKQIIPLEILTGHYGKKFTITQKRWQLNRRSSFF